MNRAGGVSNVFNHAPVAVFFAVFASFGRAEKHAACRMPQRGERSARGWVFTTSLLAFSEGGKLRLCWQIGRSHLRIFSKTPSSIESWASVGSCPDLPIGLCFSK